MERGWPLAFETRGVSSALRCGLGDGAVVGGGGTLIKPPPMLLEKDRSLMEAKDTKLGMSCKEESQVLLLSLLKEVRLLLPPVEHMDPRLVRRL